MNRKRTFVRAAGAAFIFLFAFEFLYVGAMAFFLGSSLFRKALGFQDDSLTHVAVRGAYSLFPGHLRVGDLLIAVRDQNVVIDIHLRKVEARFSVLALRKKEVYFTSFRGEGGTLDYDPKSGEETAAFYKDHPSKDELLSGVEWEEKKRRIWTVRVPLLEAFFRSLRLERKTIEGRIRVKGGFLLQPEVVAEIYPTRFQISGGKVGSEVEGLEVSAIAGFKEYPVPTTPGSKVFDYFHADLKLRAAVRQLSFLNHTLRALPGYGFGEGTGNVAARIAVRDGRLQQGSALDIRRSKMRFTAPAFEAKGDGGVALRVMKDSKKTDVTRVELFLNRGEIRVPLGTGTASISTRFLKVRADAYGVDLRNAFHGLNVLVDVPSALLSVRGPRDEKGSAGWALRSSVSGILGVVSGRAPNRLPPQSLVFRLLPGSRLAFGGSSLRLNPDGALFLQGTPFDFRPDRARAGMLSMALEIGLEKGEKMALDMATSMRKRGVSWSGSASLVFKGFDRALLAFKEPLGISGPLTALLSAHRVEADFDWQFWGAGALVRAQSVRSDGAWSLWGTYFLSKRQESYGALEGRVLGLPLGIRLPSGQFRLFPSAAWFDGRKRAKRCSIF